jgi:hypothetical protein
MHARALKKLPICQTTNVSRAALIRTISANHGAKTIATRR